MNPHLTPPASLKSLLVSLWVNRQLIMQMTEREVVGRYKGSVMGLAWSLLNPLLMLVVYTFVFSVVFKARWGGGVEESKVQFAVVLFVGLIVYALFAEVVNAAPSIIRSNTNYVKKVVFPLEILSVVSLGAALFHCTVSLFVLLSVFFAFNGYLNWTIVFLPLVLFPLIALSLGLSWIIASLGVFLRDIGQTVVIITSVMMFLSPVFYSSSSLPEEARPFFFANPLTFIIEQARDILIWGKIPDWKGLCLYSSIVLVVVWIGYAWFQKTRKGFADVL